ncbi:unnamed protein product [Symbiodinium sp. CCMP2592]|nr:unnamed protein product [Symbiodinium sp. CCMP2592]
MVAASKAMWLRVSCGAYLLLLAVTDVAEPLQAALDADGDCQGSDCALSALQVRASVEGSCGFSFSDCFAADQTSSSSLEPLTSLSASLYDDLIMPPPAMNGTTEDMAALRYNLLANSASTVLTQWSFLSDQNIFAYSAAVGANLERDAPTLSACIVAFYKPIHALKDYFKEKVKRPRPFVAHPDLKPCLPEEFSFSYPSGHATFYAATEELLGAWFPLQRDRIGYVSSSGVGARATCAVHYPSDAHAGRKLGKMAAIEVMQMPQWQSFVSQPSAKILEELAAINKSRPYAGLPIFPRMDLLPNLPYVSTDGTPRMR